MHRDRHDRTDDQSPSTPWIPWLFLAGGATVFGSATPVSKVIGEDFPLLLATLLRVLIGGLALAPFIWKDRAQLRQLSTRGWWLVTGIAAFGMVAFSLTLLYGMQYVSGVVGSAVMSTTPAVVAISAAIFFHERFGWRKVIAVLLAAGGVAVVNVAGETVQATGWSLALGVGLIFAAVCCEAAYTLLGKAVMRHASPLPVAGVASLMATVVLLPFGLWQAFTSFDPTAPGWTDWLAMLWWSLGALALGTWLWYTGVHGSTGVAAGAFMGLMPVSALVFSYIILDESFHWLHPVGFALVVVGIFFIAWARMHEQHQHQHEHQHRQHREHE